MKTVLTINTGSSSIKAALYAIDNGIELLYRADADNIGEDNGTFLIKDNEGTVLKEEHHFFKDNAEALEYVTASLEKECNHSRIQAIGHRIVHGGDKFFEPTLITESVLNNLRNTIPFDPLHLPTELDGIDILAKLYHNTPQIACFDTAFHKDLPESAKIYALPKYYYKRGIRRYGFHGLSYEYIMDTLENKTGNIVIAHLGSGASMAAVKDGKCIDTTMGFTSTAGLVMGTRCGDMDAGLIVYLMKQKHLGADAIRWMINHESGLKGLSKISSDMKTLLDMESTNPDAALAIEVFCHQARKQLAAMAASLQGIDTLIFTGGIGEKSPEIRKRVCEGLGFLGITIDDDANNSNNLIISKPSGSVTVKVIETDEEFIIARHTRRIVNAEAGAAGKK